MTSSTNSTQILTENINSVQDLLSCMASLNKSQFNACINAVDLSGCDFEPYGSWSDVHYTRNCLYCDEQYEVILLCWEKGQFTPIHDHGGEECWVKIISGSLEETIYKPNDLGEPTLIKNSVAHAGHTTYMIDFMGCHRLKNVGNERAMALHIYAKPISRCNIYDESELRYVPKDLVYHSIVEIK